MAIYADKAGLLLYYSFHIRERNIKENRFRFSLRTFGRKPCCLSLVGRPKDQKAKPYFLGPEAKRSSGARTKNRTWNLDIKSVLLCQLSYAGLISKKIERNYTKIPL